MIVIGNSIPKSGSTLFFNYTQDIVYGRIGSLTPDDLTAMTASGAIPGRGGFVSQFSEEIIERLLQLSLNKTMAVKTHAKFFPAFDAYVKTGDLKVTFIIRDPRDYLLSGMDNYQRTKDTARPEFGVFSNLDTGLQMVKIRCQNALEWINWGQALIIRYENLVDNHREVIRLCCDFLNLKNDDVFINDMISHYQTKRNFRFNTGKVNRFRCEMSEEIMEACNRELGTLIFDLGY